MMKTNRNFKSGIFNPRVLLSFTLCVAGVSLAVFGFAAPALKTPTAGSAASNNAVNAVVPLVSPQVRNLPIINPFSVKLGQLGDIERRLTGRETANPSLQDPVVQTALAAAAMPAVGVSFDGLNIDNSDCDCLPGDPNGTVGPNHYVQIVNTAFAVFNKTTGAMISGPTAINSLWAGTGTECEAQDDGDPIVIYDQLADRWLLSQFVTTANPYYAECFAVSTSPDPTGSYYLYEFDQSTTVFHDYPKVVLWPDAYYMSSNEFPNGSETNSGAGAFAFERAQMLAGQPARFVWFDESAIATTSYTPGGQLPTSLEGKALPPAGMPNFFAETDTPPTTPQPTATTSLMSLWQFHVDWSDPTKSTFGTGSTAPVAMGGGLYMGSGGQPNFSIPIADYVVAECVYGEGPNCVPEKLSPPLQPATLDTLGDRLMFRVTYRNFGDHESLLVSHTSVTTTDVMTGGTRTGIRWYELRNQTGFTLSNAPSIYQQSTFAPLDATNPLWRWMGSAAMDHSGDIAVGYSASGPDYYPSLHYAGRLATDPLGDLTQGEAVMYLGQGIQAYPLDRWGDYSNLAVDPSDDCTFWYTNEYLPANAITDVLPINWHTRIGNFRFPQCVPPAVQLTSVVSEFTHGSAGPFDVNLPLPPNSSPRAVECRSSASLGAGNYTLIFSFSANLTSVASASVSSGTGSVSGGTGAIGPNLNQYTVNLTGVADQQYITVTLNSVVDVTGATGNVVSPQLGILVGDEDASGRVDGNDVSVVQSNTRQTANISNFRNDIDCSGRIDGNDVSITQSQTRTSLPSPP